MINKIRKNYDGLEQEPTGDNLDRDGSITFLYSTSDTIDINEVKKDGLFKAWDFSDHRNTKELYLTHGLISKKAGFDDLFQIYDKDRILQQVQKIKRHLYEFPEKEKYIESKTFQEVLSLNLVSEAPAYRDFIAENNELFEIAKKTPFEDLRKLHLHKDKLIGEDKDKLINHLFKIQECIYLYRKALVSKR